MAWTSPSTWVAGATVTAAQLNTQIRDNVKAISSRVYVQRSTAGTFTGTGISSFNWDLAGTNPMAMYVAGTPSRLNCVTAGTFRVLFAIGLTVTSGTAQVNIRKNGTTVLWNSTVVSVSATFGTAGPGLYFTLLATDYLELCVTTSVASGVALANDGLQLGTVADCSMEWIGT